MGEVHVVGLGLGGGHAVAEPLTRLLRRRRDQVVVVGDPHDLDHVLDAVEGVDYELENLIQRLVIMVPGPSIGLEHLPQQLLAQSVTAHEAILLPPGGVRFDDEIRELEVALLEAALRRSEGSKTAAARLLHLDSQRMKYLCRKYSL